MKLSSLQENLKNGLHLVSHIAGKNVNLPILNNIYIEAKDGNIKFVATDLEIGITTMIRGKVEKEGEFTVESKLISDFISLLPNQKVDVELKDQNLVVKCQNYKTMIKGQTAEDYPLIPQVERDASFKCGVDEFKKGLSQTVFAVSGSETRIELSGVLFNFNTNNLTLASTDSYRLAEKQIKVKTDVDEEKNIILPAKTLHELVRVLSTVKSVDLEDSSSELEFFVSDNQILFKVGNTEIVSRLIEGQYPDYKQIMPTGSETEALVNRQELLRAIKAAAIFSKSGINDVNLDFPSGKNKVVITSASSQAGENITDLDAAVKGKDNGIVVNYRYLLDGLNNIDSENVLIKLTDNNTPCIIKSENDDAYLYIIMPIKQ